DRQAWTRNGLARWKQIDETLRRAFKIPRSLRAELQWLFEREEFGRDFLVHPDADFRETADHPVVKNTSAERSAMRIENASRSVDLLIEVLDASLKAETMVAKEWQRVHGGIIEQTRALREGQKPQRVDATN